ncbi:hypothetical protein ACHWQZ_G000654 [Mnemiopsis leidyi]
MVFGQMIFLVCLGAILFAAAPVVAQNSESNTGEACEHSGIPLTIDCGEGVIQIEHAVYGVHSNDNSCGLFYLWECAADTSLQIMQEQCDGRNYCEVHAENSVFGDPCVGVNKYLTSTWRCASPDWIPVTDGKLIVKLQDMISTKFYIKTAPSPLPSSLSIKVNFLSGYLDKLASLEISSEGLQFEVFCAGQGDEGVIRDFYREGVLQSGDWSFQKTENWFTIRVNGDDFFMFPASQECFGEGIRAVEFREEINGASRFYAGNVEQYACDAGYTVTQHGACLRCPAGQFSTAGNLTSCSLCPENKFSPPGSGSESDCENKASFDETVLSNDPTTNTTVYNAFWQLEKDVQVVFNIRRVLQKRISYCDIIVAFSQIDLEIDFEIFEYLKGEEERSVNAFYNNQYQSVTMKNRKDYQISVNFEDDAISIETTWGESSKSKKIKFKRRSGDLSSAPSQIQVSVSNKECFNFIASLSSIELLSSDSELEPDRNTTDQPQPPTDTTPTDTTPTEKLPSEAMLCASIYYRDCEMVQLHLNKTWSDYPVYSLQIFDIPPGRGIRVTADNANSYTVTDRFVDTNLNDNVTLFGFHMESEGGKFLVSLEYVEYDESNAVEEVVRMSIDRAEPDLTEYEGEEESEYVQSYNIEEEQNLEVKELILANVIPFEDDEDFEDPDDQEIKKKVKVWKPKFNESKIPIKVFNTKAENFKTLDDASAKTDLIGYFAHNGYVDVGVNKNFQKKLKKQSKEEKVTSVSRDSVVDADAMTETIKAFQKFNGFPETGQLTEQESEIMSKPRCGNRDTSFKDEIEAFTCIEADVDIESDMKRDDCALDEDSFLDICSHFPNDFVDSSEKKKEFVWKKGYYFEADVDFSKSEKKNSHLGIAFNYENSTRTSDFVFINYEKKNKRIVFSYGTYIEGKRNVVERVRVSKSVQLDAYQRRYRQFKVRIKVSSDSLRQASVYVNGMRIFTMDTSMPTKSSVYVFTLGGSNFVKHNVRVFTGRICRRNIVYQNDGEEEHSRRKRWTHTNFRWYPNGAPITYAFANYSSSLGEADTRTEVENALKAFSSHGFHYKEISPIQAASANIVFMFLRSKHADGLTFNAPGLEKAHAFVPVHGEIHFNDFEDFSVGKGAEENSKTSLKYVAMHEIGHAMGIGHSELQDAVMQKRFDPKTNVMKDGYPKRLAAVFVGAPGEIDAAFDTGSWIYLIAGHDVYIYNVQYDMIIFYTRSDLNSLFQISEKVVSAFNHRKVACQGGSDINCIRTTLVVDNTKYYEVVWKKHGKVVSRITRGHSRDIIGKEFAENLFGAAYEYTRADGSTEVNIFQKVGRTARSRVFYPGDGYVERTTWTDVPTAYGIIGWCVG